jgi:hypothetical protein
MSKPDDPYSWKSFALVLLGLASFNLLLWLLVKAAVSYGGLQHVG